jgi:hypothetical protein
MTPERQQGLTQAIAYSLGDPGERRGTAHAALLAMLQRVEPAAVVKDIEALMSELLGIDGRPLDPATICSSVYAALPSFSEARAAVILAEKTKPYPFRYDESSPALGELSEFVDARLNAVLVKHLMAALNAAILCGEVTREHCLGITDRILADSRNRTNPAYLAALERSIRRTHAKAPGKTIVYLSLGCGSGREDAAIVAGLKRKFPDLEMRVVGFDPFQKHAAKHPIVTELGGALINRELGPGETFASVLQEATDNPEAAIVATERYALHHMGRSPARLLRELDGAALVSVEEPVTALQRNSLYHRLAASGYDILANHALEQRFGGSWMAEARENPELFSSLYRRLEDLQAQQSEGVVVEKVEGVWPATYVITYPAQETRAL